MRVDADRTAAARERHEAGIRRLREIFGSGWKGNMLLEAGRFSLASGAGKPVRLRPHVPPIRDAEHEAKHKARKRTNAARRRNRR